MGSHLPQRNKDMFWHGTVVLRDLLRHTLWYSQCAALELDRGPAKSRFFFSDSVMLSAHFPLFCITPFTFISDEFRFSPVVVTTALCISVTCCISLFQARTKGRTVSRDCYLIITTSIHAEWCIAKAVLDGLPPTHPPQCISRSIPIPPYVWLRR
jgi:hypothetical protein